ncbi:MAG: LysR substrate-binding domain-containing protein, partial [Burkholderiaceae bacterium]
PLQADWLTWKHRLCPEDALRATVDHPPPLLDAIQDGALDLAIVYSPAQRPGLVCELLMDEKLVLVSTATDGRLQPSQYVYVDWGPAFAANHDGAFPALANPPVSISLGPLALAYLLSVGGCGYFRAGAVRELLADGRLQRVAGAPEFSHSVYAVYAARNEHATLARARDGLRLIAADAEGRPPLPPAHPAKRIKSS